MVYTFYVALNNAWNAMEMIIAIIGVGYVGLQNAIAISKLGLHVIAFDKNKNRVEELRKGIDNNHEAESFTRANLEFTDNLEDLAKAHYYLISVPTPINSHFIPNTHPLRCAAKEVGEVLKKEDVVILESTVFPGATRQLLIPILENMSGLKSGEDFYVGYSSERIVPGDSSHNLSNMYKVISGQNEKSLEKVKHLYEKIVSLRLHAAPSLEVAESSKLLENIQRDVNIALMNEYAQVMEKMEIPFHEVLEAASTKWNFLPFKPGLVGGHCIPEDPYYLIYQANKVGGLVNLISSARQVNERFVYFIINMLVKLMTRQELKLTCSHVVIMGISFKPNVNDIRHSLSLVLYKLLHELGIPLQVCDPIADKKDSDLPWIEFDEIPECSAIILTQAHDVFLEISPAQYSEKIIQKGIFIDIPGAFTQKEGFREDISYWSL